MRRSMVVFVHVPKTAGTTFKHVLRANALGKELQTPNIFISRGGVARPDYPRVVELIKASRQVEVLSGHTPFALAGHLPPDWAPQYVTLLRDPVKRAVSHYYHLLDTYLHPRGEVRPYVDEMPFEDVLTSVDYVADNLQTRMLCGDPMPFGEATRAMLDQAKRNLAERFTLVGLAERFDETLVLLRSRIGYANILYEPARVNAGRPRDEAIPPKLENAAAEANVLDAELYEFGKECFAAAPERRDLEFDIELAALRLAKGHPEPERPTPPESFPGDERAWSILLGARAALLRERSEHGRTRRRLREAVARGNSRTREQVSGSDRAAIEERLAATVTAVERERDRLRTLEQQAVAASAHSRVDDAKLELTRRRIGRFEARAAKMRAKLTRADLAAP